MKSTDLKTLVNEIIDNKIKFESLTRKEKRILIAKDCLIRIKFENIIPVMGIFLDDDWDGNRFDKYGKRDEVLMKPLINNGEFECEACAKGSLFISYIGRVSNKFTNETISCGNDIKDDNHKALLKIFTPTQLMNIEFAYEGYVLMPKLNGEEYKISDESFKIVREFQKILSDEIKLIKICENIIKNNGDFKLKNLL